jgi:hypothetical protein
MKKISLTTFLLIIAIASFSQNGINDIFNKMGKNAQTKKISPFSVSTATVSSVISSNTFKEGFSPVLLNVDTKALTIIDVKTTLIELSIPLNNKDNLELELFVVDIFGTDFKVLDANGKEVPYTKGLNFHGRIKGDEKSIAAVSIANGEISGIISDKSGTRTLGKLKDSNVYSLHYDDGLVKKNPFTCQTEDSPVGSNNNSPGPAGLLGCKSVGIYLEADNATFVSFGSNAQNTVNYIVGLIAQVNILYRNENLAFYITQIKVWNIADPYVSATNTSTALTLFRNNIGTTFTGNISHLISTRSLGGGIAYVDVLCNKSYGHAVSSIDTYYSPVPTYSWSVMVLAHEMGHNFGSNHTQWCGWSGGALDNCYTTEGGCAAGPAPTNGGTIMSYCHTKSFGINLSNGFGTQPGNKIRNQVSICNQIGIINSPVQALSSNNINLTTAVVTWAIHNTSSSYTLAYRRLGESNFTTINTTNNVYTLTQLYSGVQYEWKVLGDCANAYSPSEFFTTQVNLSVGYANATFALCPGLQTISFYSLGISNLDNTAYFELSNQSGSFTSPIILTSVLSNIANNTGQPINLTIPDYLTSGAGYKLRIRTTSPAVIGSLSDLTINQPPPKPQFSFSSSNLFCNTNPVTITVNNCPGQVFWGSSTTAATSLVVTPTEGNTYQANCQSSTNACSSLSVSPAFKKVNQGTQNLIIQWEKSFGGTAGDYFADIVKTADGGYLAIDESGSPVSGNKTQPPRGQSDGLIVKFDINGNVVWEKAYGGSGYDILIRIKALSDGNFMVLGRSSTGIEYEKTSSNKGNIDFWLFKIDPNGNIIWDRTFGANSIDYGNDFMATSDGGIILVGTVFMDATTSAANGDRSQNGKGDHDAWVIKIDANGNKVWDRIFGGTGTETANKIVKAVDNSGYYIFGFTTTTNIAGSDLSAPARNGSDAWLFKFDENGNKIFDKVYSGGNTYSGLSSIEDISEMAALPDGNYLLAAHSNNNAGNEKTENSMGDDDLWLIKISPIGTIIKEKTMGGNGYDNAGSLFVRSDGSILVCGINGSNQNVDKKDALKGNYDAWILNVDSNLNLIWSEKLGGTIIDPNPLIETFTRMIYEGNDIFTFVGYSSESKGDRTQSFGGVDGWVVKMKIPLATKPIISSTNALACIGESITLSVSGCTSDILWSNGLTSASIVVKPNSNDNVFAVNCRTDANNCISVQSEVYRPVVADVNQNLTGTAASGIVQAKQTITSRQIIQPNTDVSYRAGQYVLLEKNQSFEARSGSIFKAEIAPCAIENGLLARYDFSNNILDQSGNNKNGLVNTALFTKDRFGNSNSALSFNGVNQYVTLGNWFNYQEFTVSFWVSAGATQANAYAELIDNNHTASRSWLAQQDNTSNNLYYFGAIGSPTGTVLFNLTSTWNHVTFIKAAGIIKMYLNGKLVGTAPHGGNIPYDGTQNLILGAWYSSGGFNRFWNGSMDDLKLYNRALSDTEITTIFQAEAPNPGLNTGLFANYKFDGDANDVSGKGNNGTLINGPTFTTDRFGQPNKAINFDGIDDHVSVPNNNTLSGFNEITMSAWVNHNQTTGTLGAIIAKWYQSIQDNYLMVLAGGTNKFGAYTNNERGISFESPNSIPINTWNHLVFTHDSSGDKLFFNGYLVASNTVSGTIIYSPQNLLIGADSNLGTLWRFFKGKVDDVRLYNRALSRLEVQQLYDLEKP